MPITDSAGRLKLIGIKAFLLIGISVFVDRHAAFCPIAMERFG